MTPDAGYVRKKINVYLGGGTKKTTNRSQCWAAETLNYSQKKKIAKKAFLEEKDNYEENCK